MYTQKWFRYAGVLWALLGISLLLVFAMHRLYSNFQSLDAISLTINQEIILVAWAGFMLYAEGYRGFQKKFSPRFAVKARLIQQSATIEQIVLAPLFCMGFFGVKRKEMARTWLLTGVIVLFVVLAGVASDPWRGIISGGVMLGLTYGLATVWLLTLLAIRNDSVHNHQRVTQD